MVWTAPTSKWKTQTWYPATCGNGQCVVYQRFDTLANPRVIEIVGFSEICGDHVDVTNPVPVGRLQNFLGEWMTERELLAWERTFYSWVVSHEIGERSDLTINQVIEMQAKQAVRSKAVAEDIPNLDRVDTDDGPWKPTDAVVTLPKAEIDANTALATWVQRDDRLQQRVFTEGETRVEGFRENDAVSWWFEGSGGGRVLHVDSGGLLNKQQQNQIDAAVDLLFGPGRLVWEG